VLLLTGFLITASAAAFWLLERNHAFAGMSSSGKVFNALFQSITPRTAGFNAVPQVALGQASKFLTIVLMFIGGAPGSIAGGIKISTAFLVLLVMVRQPNERGEINAFRRRLSPGTTNAAITCFLRAGLLLLIATALLSLSEGGRGTDLGRIIFEAVSAFGTVGLSLNVTSGLSTVGKLVIIVTMYAGRVGLVALALPAMNWKSVHIVYPEADVLVG
jgi:trk system potassium uptake protein TrkH